MLHGMEFSVVWNFLTLKVLIFQATHHKFIDNYNKAKQWLRSSVILLFLLVFQWIFNMIAPFMDDLSETARDVFDYLSICFNCTIGFWVFIYSVGCQRVQRYRTAPKSYQNGAKSATRSTRTKSTKLSTGANGNVRQRM